MPGPRPVTPARAVTSARAVTPARSVTPAKAGACPSLGRSALGDTTRVGPLIFADSRVDPRLRGDDGGLVTPARFVTPAHPVTPAEAGACPSLGRSALGDTTRVGPLIFADSRVDPRLRGDDGGLVTPARFVTPAKAGACPSLGRSAPGDTTRVGQLIFADSRVGPRLRGDDGGLVARPVEELSSAMGDQP